MVGVDPSSVTPRKTHPSFERQAPARLPKVFPGPSALRIGMLRAGDAAPFDTKQTSPSHRMGSAVLLNRRIPLVPGSITSRTVTLGSTGARMSGKGGAARPSAIGGGTISSRGFATPWARLGFGSAVLGAVTGDGDSGAASFATSAGLSAASGATTTGDGKFAGFASLSDRVSAGLKE